MEWIKKELIGKNDHHVDQSHGRGLFETKPYETTADKMGVVPSHQLQERPGGTNEPVDQSGGRGLFETKPYVSTADQIGVVPSQQLQEARGMSVAGQGSSSDTYIQPTVAPPTTGTSGIDTSRDYDDTTTGTTTGGLTSTSGYDNTTSTTGTSGLTGSSSGYGSSSDQYATTGSTSQYTGNDTSLGTSATLGSESTGHVVAVDPLLQSESAESVAARVMGARGD